MRRGLGLLHVRRGLVFLMVSPTSDVAIGEAHGALVRGVFDPPVRVAGAIAATLDPCIFANTWPPVHTRRRGSRPYTSQEFRAASNASAFGTLIS